MSSTVATAVVKIAADIGDFDKGLVKAQKQLLKTADAMESWGKKLSLGFTAPLVAASAALAKSAAEDAASLSKLDRAFGSSASSMEKFIGQMMRVTPATDDQLRQLVSNTQAFNLSLGLTPAKATAMTQSITRLAADLAAYNHVELSAASEAITSALEGKTKALKALNVVVSEAEIKNKGLAAIEARMTVMRGEAARTIGEDQNAWARFQQSLDSAADSMGKAVLPTFAKILDVASNFAKQIGELDSTTKTWIVTIGVGVASLGPLLIISGTLTKAWVAMNAAMLALTSEGFAGLDLLLSPGGLILAGLAAVGTLIYLTGAHARQAKADLDAYALGLVGLPKKELEVQAARLQGLINTESSLQVEASRKGASADSSGVYGGLRTMGSGQRAATSNDAVDRHATNVTTLQGMLDATNRQIKLLGGGGAGGGGPVASVFDTMIDRAKSLTKEQADTRLVTDQLTKSVMDLTSAYGALAGKFDTVSLKQRDTLRDAIGGANAALFGDLDPSKLALAKSANYDIGANHPGAPGVTAPAQSAYNASWGAIMNLRPTPITATNSNSVVALNRNTEILKAGLERVAASIGTELAGQLVAVIGGQGRGSSFGSRTGGEFGSGVGSFYAKTATSALAAASLPIVGGILGAIAGGLFGSLFNHKKAIDDNTKALEQLNESLTNAPAGFKIGPFRYQADGSAPGAFASGTDSLMRDLNRAGDDFAARGGVAFVGG